jgi:hypothetical protein
MAAPIPRKPGTRQPRDGFNGGQQPNQIAISAASSLLRRPRVKPRFPQASKKERTKEGWDWRWTPGRPPFGPNSVPVEFDRQDRQEGERLRRSATTCWRPNGTVPVDAIGMIDAIGGDAFGEVPIVREETDVERAAR